MRAEPHSIQGRRPMKMTSLICKSTILAFSPLMQAQEQEQAQALVEDQTDRTSVMVGHPPRRPSIQQVTGALQEPCQDQHQAEGVEWVQVEEIAITGRLNCRSSSGLQANSSFGTRRRLMSRRRCDWPGLSMCRLRMDVCPRRCHRHGFPL